jgi:hypothetical protein
MANAAHDPDWMARMIGSYQSKSLLEGARRGAVSDEHGTSFVPALASGSSFGRLGLTKGWNSDEKHLVQGSRSGNPVTTPEGREPRVIEL